MTVRDSKGDGKVDGRLTAGSGTKLYLENGTVNRVSTSADFIMTGGYINSSSGIAIQINDTDARIEISGGEITGSVKASVNPLKRQASLLLKDRRLSYSKTGASLAQTQAPLFAAHIRGTFRGSANGLHNATKPCRYAHYRQGFDFAKGAAEGYFCLMKILMGVPFRLHRSRILFSRKRR